MTVIEIDGMTKSYRGNQVLNGVSLTVERGEIFGIAGPNGAGKTTTVECASGLRERDGGVLRVLGLDPRADRRRLLPRIGVQLQEAALPDAIKVGEALKLYASFYDAPADWRALMEEWGLAERRRISYSSLSGGWKQRLFIALALVGNPEVVFLDELTTGLDPSARRMTWSLIRDIRDRGVTVVLVTHFMDEAEALCDRIAIVDHGRVVTHGTPGELIAQAHTDSLEDAYFALTGGQAA
ncbi:ATP-binding cassette domain-containing protein [Nonomuraea phyllanthi]|uniref:ATP-binding cassette domain-containing protein n=1 Tax=Nonomuraea phyllanthi TaxID=2219224 RepID=A0A5C4WH51_9ACTN|nr:ABC transporter ATP-binding protein [Nonomuraea phyllanthi]KAB8193549.1 ATP-binding cassette domain-containing protein [Nonomuraea phyllanthi]QFY12290.1 ATP-binding cassette domain-containing protein [Nonomuraea phyllanthi]